MIGIDTSEVVQEIVAAVTAGSVDNLGLAPGETFVVLIKATEVMIGRE